MSLINSKISAKSDYVDLGLPSGTLWCSHNLGGETETDFGLYYQWASTDGFNKSNSYKISIETTPYYKDREYTKYGKNDVLDKSYDAVYKETNGLAKLPTKEQIQELIDNTKSEWTKIDGVAGGKFTGKNGNYIFIPTAGCFYINNGSFYDSGSHCYLWSSSMTDNSCSDYSLYFSSDGCYLFCIGRYNGFSVRGVC